MLFNPTQYALFDTNILPYQNETKKIIIFEYNEKRASNS